ncbi:hypothetical protein BJ085DRAFT_33353 [Dimargaris cristalligena]|uniref:Uncharacterized protein n=1 Tax=Dimargaris cristalligena TaxID=215637 RepID=A0A4Q0A1A2_9FUNG|nr:hypothetical protein BJ085DRAFT_33353 [Dimargaris cristalligena]|eukprot:RKP39231.1 hypothetical protein BJ085DRAFT_33353 [Dimargaris cristalligena]
MWDTYSPLWYTLANLETWDTYLKSLRPRPNAPPAPSQMEIELGRRYMAEMKKRQQKPGQAVARESLAYSRRIPVCLREISPESLKQEFPVVSRATGKLLADLLVLVSNRRGPPLSPAADPTMIPAAEPQFLIDRTLSFGAAKVILPTVVDRMTTAGLWRLYCLDQWDEIQNYFKLAGQVAEKASATRGGVGETPRPIGRPWLTTEMFQFLRGPFGAAG